MFALAERQLVRRSDVTGTTNVGVLQLQNAEEETVTGEEQICEERTDETVYITKKNRRTKKRRKIELCEWVKKKRNARCKRIVKKRKRNTDPDIDRKFVKVCYNPKKYCEDVCADVDVNPTTPVSDSDLPIKMSCPLEEYDMEARIGGNTCAGFTSGHKCHYNKVNVGCTAETFRCMPLTTCTCTPNLRDTWSCATYLPPEDYYCPEAPRPKPADWQDPPDGLREPCEMLENENATEGDSTIQLRRRGLLVPEQ